MTALRSLAGNVGCDIDPRIPIAFSQKFTFAYCSGMEQSSLDIQGRGVKHATWSRADSFFQFSVVSRNCCIGS